MSTAEDNPENRTDRAARLREAIRRKKARKSEGGESKIAEISPRPADQPARLSEFQQGLWLAQRLEPESPAYHLAGAFRVDGELDRERLYDALTRVVANHRILRSTFRAVRGEVEQVVHESIPIRPTILETDDVEASALQEARRPFDLENGPLLRMSLHVNHATGETLLLLAMHHLLADERSLAFLWDELAATYAGRPADAPTLQYDDYVDHLHRRPASSEDLSSWRERLDPLPEDLALPFERTVAEGAAAGRLIRRPLDSAIQDGVRRLAGEIGATPFQVYAFVFRLLLHRFTDGRRVAFGVPVTARSHPSAAKMLGYFLHATPVCIDLDETQDVRSCVQAFVGELRALLARPISFQTLVEELDPPRSPGRSPIFQTMFVYQETPTPPILGDARLEPLTLDLGASKFDLTLFATEGASPELAIEYRSDRFEEAWMSFLLDQYAELLEALPDDLNRPTAEVRTVSPQEAQGPALVAELDLLPRAIAEQARRTPDDPAVVYGGRSVSYAEMLAQARAVANRLEAGTRVGVSIPRSPEMISAIVGCHLAGAAYVPLDPTYPEERNQAILDDAEVATVLTSDDLRGDDPGSFEIAATAESPAYLLYTSGSTGRPKGAVITHENLRRSTAARLQAYGEKPRRFLLVPSIAFDSSVAGLFWTLATGGALVVPTDDEARDPRALARLVVEQKVTSLLCVPSLYARMLDFIDEQRFASLEFVVVAGESCPSALIEEHTRLVPQAKLYNEYGPTEATVWSSVGELRPGEPPTIGRPIPGVEIEVLDVLGRRAPPGVLGEAYVSGKTVAQGYWKRPGLTKERFTDDRYRTGDRMSWTLDGRLLFHGRVDEQIKVRGVRIEPGEIESALTSLPDVDEAAVIVRSDLLIAFYRGDGDPRGRREDLKRRLPETMIPTHWERLDELPKLPNGKVDRKRLQAIEPTQVPETEKIAMRVADDRETALLSLWEGLLERPGISLEDNFFELGGHSLLVAQMTLSIERDFGVRLSASDVFEHPTVIALAKRIEQSDATNEPYRHLFPMQPSGRGAPLIVAVPHFFTPMYAERFRGERPVYGLRGVSLRAEGNRGLWPTMTALAEELVDEATRRFPDAESFDFAGYSFGASMAQEAVRVMEKRGIAVRRLDLITPMPVAFRRPPQLRHRFWCDVVGRARHFFGLELTPKILHSDVRLERFRLQAGFQPGVVRTPTFFFNGEGSDVVDEWRPFFEGPLTVVEMPDPHLGGEAIEAAKRTILRSWEDET